MNYSEFTIDIIGWIGAFCYLLPYYLLIMKRWGSTSVVYQVFNILGSILLIINTVYYGSIPSAFTNTIWGGIAVYGMWSDRKKVAE